MLANTGIVTADETGLLASAAAWSGSLKGSDLTRAELGRLAGEQGIDFATALLYEQLLSSWRHGPFIQQIDEIFCHPPERLTLDLLFAVVPGAFYQELPGTGA